MTAGVVRVNGRGRYAGLGFVGCAKGSRGGRAQGAGPRTRRGQGLFRDGADQEQLVRATVFYGLGGFTQSLIFGIDIALWDLKGKLPGGRSMTSSAARRSTAPALSHLLGREALEEFGIRDVKIAVPYGPDARQGGE